MAIFCVLLLVLAFPMNHSIWIPTIDFFHLLYALLFINMTLPPNPAYALSKALIPTLNFLPNIFSNALPSAKYDSSISSTIYTFIGDLIFLRSQGFLFTVLLVLIAILLVMVVLWKRKVAAAKKFCKTFVKETFWKKYLHGFVYLFFLPCFVIGLMKMRNYTADTAIEGFSIFCSYLFMIPMLVTVIYFIYKVFRLLRDHPQTC